MYIIYLHKVDSVATRETDPKGETFIVAIFMTRVDYFQKLFSAGEHLFYAYGYILENSVQLLERKYKHSRKKNI